MLRIGAFSRFSQVPVKTLRYYDEIGLLKPERVDSSTGYRHYSFDQLPRLNRILVLKDLGLSLEQIARTLAQDLSAEEMRGMLKLKRAGLESHMRQVKAQIERVEARLQLIEMEGQMPEYDVVLKTVDAQEVASVREESSAPEAIGATLDRTFDMAGAFVQQSAAKFAGPGIALWHADLDAEAALPIDRPLQGEPPVVVRQLPQARMACLVHRGNFSGFTQAYKAGYDWLAGNGYRLAGPVREVYLKHDRQAPDQSVTELQFPVEAI